MPKHAKPSFILFRDTEGCSKRIKSAERRDSMQLARFPQEQRGGRLGGGHRGFTVSVIFSFLSGEVGELLYYLSSSACLK